MTQNYGGKEIKLVALSVIFTAAYEKAKIGMPRVIDFLFDLISKGFSKEPQSIRELNFHVDEIFIFSEGKIEVKISLPKEVVDVAAKLFSVSSIAEGNELIMWYSAEEMTENQQEWLRNILKMHDRTFVLPSKKKKNREEILFVYLVNTNGTYKILCSHKFSASDQATIQMFFHGYREDYGFPRDVVLELEERK